MSLNAADGNSKRAFDVRQTPKWRHPGGSQPGKAVGFDVYATEVEAAIRTHPSVLMASVVGVPHEAWGESIHAEVILKEGHALDVAELTSHVEERLAHDKAPKSMIFVSELPLSAAGKVLRRVVREKFWVGHDRRVS